MDEWGALRADGGGRMHYPPSMDHVPRPVPAAGRVDRRPSECGAWRAVHGEGTAIPTRHGGAGLPRELAGLGPAAQSILGAALDGEVPEGPHGAILADKRRRVGGLGHEHCRPLGSKSGQR